MQIYGRFIATRNQCVANRVFVVVAMIYVALNVTRITVAALVVNAIHAVHFIGRSLIKRIQLFSSVG